MMSNRPPYVEPTTPRVTRGGRDRRSREARHALAPEQVELMNLINWNNLPPPFNLEQDLSLQNLYMKDPKCLES